MPRTHKPCPACGGTDSIRDSAKGICRKCKGLIAFAIQRQKDDALLNGKEVLIKTKERDYAIPGYYPKVTVPLPSDVTSRLKRALYTSIMAQSRPAAGGYPNEALQAAVEVPSLRGYSGSSVYEWSCLRWMRKDQAEAMVELDAAMRAVLEAATAAGYEKGQNLLLSVAAGDVSVNELNKKAIGK